MQKRKLNNAELDRIGKMLITSTSVRESESRVDDIVANPALFDSVRARIASQPSRTSSTNAFGFVRRNAVTLSVVLCISIAAFSFGLLRTTKDVVVARHAADSRGTQASTAAPTKSYEPDRVSEPARTYPEDEFRPQRATATVSRVVPVKTVHKPVAEVPDAGEFVAVSYAGDRSEMERGGRIIRVDMPRSALFAMGVNIPLENDAEVIKADLLVGNDGVTRAIRIVE